MKQDLDTSLLFPSVIGRAHLALDKDGSRLSAERFKRGAKKIRAASPQGLAGPADRNQSTMEAGQPGALGTFVRLAILDVWCDPNGQEELPMTKKHVATFALAFAIGSSVCASAFAGERHHHPKPQPERYVPADGNLIDILFGGPRYYDQQLFTTAAGACSYDKVGPDANAVNKINDHHCGK